MGSLSAAIWGHQGLGLSPKQLRGLRSQAALAGRRQQLGSVDVVFSLGEGNCCDPLRTVILQHWRTLHKLLFAQPMPEQYLRLWKITWTKLLTAPKRWALVKGPVAAMVAYIQDLGVEASDPATWRFPAGSLKGPGLWRFEKDTVLVTPGLSTVHRVEEALRRLLQHTANQRISQQDAGTGANCGVDWSVPRKLLRKQTKRLPPSNYTDFPTLPPDLLLPCMSGICSPGISVNADGLVFGTDATGTTNDQRTRVVAAAVVACTLKEGQATEVGRITQVLPPGTSVVQGEALALALLLRHTTGQVEVTADCRPAILQAGSNSFREAHANVWESVWEERHRLLITWHPSHRTSQEYTERYGDPQHWRVQLNDLADCACKDAAANIPWKQHAEAVAQIDELVEEVSHFLADRAWTMLTGISHDLSPNHPRPVPDLGKFQLHRSHSFYNMGAVLLCTKCFAVHKPGQLTPFKVVKEPCVGASRAHAERRAYWAQRYLLETTAPANLFGNISGKTAAEEIRSAPARPSPMLSPPAVDLGHQDSGGSKGSGPHTLEAVAVADGPTLEIAAQAKTEKLQCASHAPVSVDRAAMAEEARKGQGKGKGKGANEGYHPFKGKGKGQAKAGKGKGQGKEPAQASAVRLDPVLETAYQLYLSGRRPEQPGVQKCMVEE
ncbi:unnamed protein product [Symbiodinium microadriaticum]|nr:unnamed protein product [Symbiodinium microadriaticum]